MLRQRDSGAACAALCAGAHWWDTGILEPLHALRDDATDLGEALEDARENKG